MRVEPFGKWIERVGNVTLSGRMERRLQTDAALGLNLKSSRQ